MTEQQIYVLMAKTPDIRAVQIADALDQETDDVVAALGPLMRIGHVEQKNGKSPSGFPVLQYNLTDKFRQSAEYQPVAAILAKQKDAVAPQPTAPVTKRIDADGQPVIRKQTSAGAEVTIKSASAATQTAAAQEVSRADLGIAYVTKMKRPVTNQEMRQAMGLHKGQAPSGWLGAAIRNNKVHKAGDMWAAGPRPAEQVEGAPKVPVFTTLTEPMNAPSATTSPANAVKSAVVGDVFVAAPGAEALASAVAAIAVAPTLQQSPVFRCGYWSDGVLELQRDGSTIARLEQREGEQLVGFFQRMLANNAAPVQTSARARTE